MKVHGRTLTVLLVVLAVLGFAGGDGTLAQQSANLVLEFTSEGRLVSVTVGKDRLSPTKYTDSLKIEKWNTVGIAFWKAEKASPAWCSAWIGTEWYIWQC
jgi:hypothetical protein